MAESLEVVFTVYLKTDEIPYISEDGNYIYSVPMCVLGWPTDLAEGLLFKLSRGPIICRHRHCEHATKWPPSIRGIGSKYQPAHSHRLCFVIKISHLVRSLTPKVGWKCQYWKWFSADNELVPYPVKVMQKGLSWCWREMRSHWLLDWYVLTEIKRWQGDFAADL